MAQPGDFVWKQLEVRRFTYPNLYAHTIYSYQFPYPPKGTLNTDPNSLLYLVLIDLFSNNEISNAMYPCAPYSVHSAIKFFKCSPVTLAYTNNKISTYLRTNT